MQTDSPSATHLLECWSFRFRNLISDISGRGGTNALILLGFSLFCHRFLPGLFMCKGINSPHHPYHSCPLGALKTCPLIRILQIDRNALLMECTSFICKETLKSQEQSDLRATEICITPTGSRFCTYLSTWLKCHIVHLKTTQKCFWNAGQWWTISIALPFPPSLWVNLVSPTNDSKGIPCYLIFFMIISVALLNWNPALVLGLLCAIKLEAASCKCHSGNAVHP